MSTLLFIGHEASATGAPFTQLYLIRWLKKHTSHRIVLILLIGGTLEEEFRQVADEVHVITLVKGPVTLRERAVAKLDRMTGFRSKAVMSHVKQLEPALIFANTALTISYAAEVKRITGAKLLLNVHELDSTFYYFTPARFEANVDTVDKFIMGSRMVKSYYQQWCAIEEQRVTVVYDFIDTQLAGASTAAMLRTQLGIPGTSKVVGSIAVLYPRKGADVFVRVAQQVLEQEPDTYFVWVGGRTNSPEYKALQRDLKLLGLEKRVLFVGEQRDLRGYYELWDIFLLPSREDPFPLVCLEAALAGSPIICFEQAGGMPEFVRDDAGVVVPYLNDRQMAAQTLRLLRNAVLVQQLGDTARQRVLSEHTIATIGPEMYKVMTEFIP
jgi:glycosyltransferase involved in cell wall biosynthesis